MVVPTVSETVVLGIKNFEKEVTTANTQTCRADPTSYNRKHRLLAVRNEFRNRLPERKMKRNEVVQNKNICAEAERLSSYRIG